VGGQCALPSLYKHAWCWWAMRSSVLIQACELLVGNALFQLNFSKLQDKFDCLDLSDFVETVTVHCDNLNQAHYVNIPLKIYRCMVREGFVWP
jgi:hypothetical protein